MRHTIPAYEFRRRARMAMKPVMPLLLIVALIAALPSLISNAVILVADADPNQLMNNLSDRMMQVMEGAGLTQSPVVGEVVVDQTQLTMSILGVYEQYMADLTTFVTEKGPLLLALAVMVAVASPVLTMGLINALLHALRKQEFTPVITLSRVKCILKALGLMLLVGLKIFLWMLPGTALMLTALFLPQKLMGLAMLVGFVAMVALGVVASYRYAMAVYVMADEPTRGIRDCIRRSKEVMKHRKLEFFSLEISFIGWHLLLSYAQSMLYSFGPVIGMTLGMFASLFLTVYTNCAQAAFYQEYAVGPLTATQAPLQEDEPEELT